MYFFLKNVIPKNIIIHLINTGSVFSFLSKNKKNLVINVVVKVFLKMTLYFVIQPQLKKLLKLPVDGLEIMNYNLVSIIVKI